MKRFKNETYEAYKRRIKKLQKQIKESLKGFSFYNRGGTYRRGMAKEDRLI